MPFDPTFPIADPRLTGQNRGPLRITVRPYPPANGSPDNRVVSDGIDDWIVPGRAHDDTSYPDDWIVPGNARDEASYPDDWIVPAPSVAANVGQRAPSGQPNGASSGVSGPFAPPFVNPFVAAPISAERDLPFLSAARIGALAWHPPYLPITNPPPFSFDKPPVAAWPASESLLGGIPNTIAPDGLLAGLSQLASSSGGSEGLFPIPPQQQSASTQAISPIGRSPTEGYSTGEILGDAAKSFGMGIGRDVIHSAGFPGDAREMLANGAQQAADYLAPDFAPNAGSTLSKYLASYPLLAGPTSSQLQQAVESYTGPFYQPKTIAGEYAQTAGEFVPGALFMPGGGLASNALRYGLLPAISSETAGQLTKDTAAEPWARTLAAILTAAPSALRNLPRARSAPDIVETLPARGPAPSGGVGSAQEGIGAPAVQDAPILDRAARLRLNVELGRAGEEAVGIPAHAPKPSIEIPGSGITRYPDRLTRATIEEVKNVQYLPLTQQLMDYLAYARNNDLTFILHVRPETKYSGPLQRLIDAGEIKLRHIPGPPR